mmetsp:Transcript_49718/g.131167  ORF Transcript_49718/g.131167 Transcript_49718/m.131167 type:complete len:627 (+) Transcript_49718:80-1960(+)
MFNDGDESAVPTRDLSKGSGLVLATSPLKQLDACFEVFEHGEVPEFPDTSLMDHRMSNFILERDGVALRHARHLGTSLRVLLATFRKPRKKDESTRGRRLTKQYVFDRVRRVQAVQHPNICELLEVCEDKHHFHLAYELPTGGFIFRASRVPFTASEAWHVEKSVIEAVCFMHRKGIFHRMLGIDNILLEPDSSQEHLPIVKVWGFGLGDLWETPSTLGDRCPLPLYFTAPEQLDLKSIEADAEEMEAADVWSIGCVSFMLACNSAPFTGGTAPAVAKAISSGSWRVRAVFDVLPPAHKDMIVTCLKHRPRVRRRSADLPGCTWMSQKPHVKVTASNFVAAEAAVRWRHFAAARTRERSDSASATSDGEVAQHQDDDARGTADENTPRAIMDRPGLSRSRRLADWHPLPFEDVLDFARWVGHELDDETIQEMGPKIVQELLAVGRGDKVNLKVFAYGLQRARILPPIYSYCVPFVVPSGHRQKHPVLHYARVIAQQKGHKPFSVKSLVAIFRAFDKDHSGSLDHGEFQVLLEGLKTEYRSEWTEADLSKLVQAASEVSSMQRVTMLALIQVFKGHGLLSDTDMEDTAGTPGLIQALTCGPRCCRRTDDDDMIIARTSRSSMFVSGI